MPNQEQLEILFRAPVLRHNLFWSWRMSMKREKLESLLEFLKEECISGFAHMQMSRRLEKVLRAGQVRHVEFLASACVAHQFCELAYLIRLFDTGKSLTIHYLLNKLQGNPNLFNDPRLVVHHVMRDQEWLDRKSDTIETLKRHRNKHVMHNDEVLLRAGDEPLFDRPLTYSGSYRLYHEAKDLLNRYLRLYYGPSGCFEFIDPSGHVDDLLADFR